MSLLEVFEEKQEYMNYNGELDVHKNSIYLPIILNKKFVNVVGNPYNRGFSIKAMSQTTRVMWKILNSLESTKTFWKTVKRVELLK